MRMRIMAAAVLLGLGLVSQHGSAAQQAPPKPAASALADMDGLLAPVALYPDQLLAQMFLCAGDPAKVVEFSGWLNANAKLTGTDLQDAATVEGYDPSFVALAVFPKVVHFMAEEREWTTQLGKAFVTDKSAVFASIQRLRKNAHQAGSLKTTPQQEVETKTTPAGEQVIVIEPANPQIVYVPQYNPQVVYTQPPPTTVVVEDDDDADAAIAGVIGFTAGIAIGAAMDNSYYYGPYGWHGGAYMYNDAWDDYYDAREDAREDWADHREDLVEERGERAGNTQEQRTERQDNRQENRPETQAQRTERQQTRQESGAPTQAQRDQARAQADTAATQARSSMGSSYEAKGVSGERAQTPQQRSGTGSDAISGYSNGKSERAASARGQQSRGGGGRGGGGGGRGGGGRRR
jgi:uncharacterized membrane protein YgcG